MKVLKSTLSTLERPRPKDKEEANGSLLRGVNKSKSQSYWAIEVEGDRVTEASLHTDPLLRILNEKLESASRKDSKAISETTFEKMVEEFQDEAAPSKSELACLMLIEDKLADITEIARENFKPFLSIFATMLNNKIARIRKKEKNAELSNFDTIVTSNFKKKPEQKAYFQAEQPKPQRQQRISKEKGARETSTSRKASGSADKKLNRLLSNDKNKDKNTKDSIRKEEAVNATTVDILHDESISFSAALATNVTVRTRKRRSNEKREKTKKVEQASQKDADEAFIFFRPKKSKK